MTWDVLEAHCCGIPRPSAHLNEGRGFPTHIPEILFFLIPLILSKFPIIVFCSIDTTPVWVNYPVQAYSVRTTNNSLLSLSAITSVWSSHNCARPMVFWISSNKGFLYEFHWLFELQSTISHKCRNDGCVSKKESGTKGIERKLLKDHCVFDIFQDNSNYCFQVPQKLSQSSARNCFKWRGR